MIQKLKQANKFQQSILLSTVIIFGILLLTLRIYKTESVHFLFLIWNLFLAIIPWGISSLLVIFPKLRKRYSVLITAGIIWLLFIPNTFYIITDLFHLHYKNLAPIWYDLLLIFTFAWAGILLGFSSLKDAELILSEKTNCKLVPLFTSIVLFIISFGIYLGRFLRWNSWNIINEPSNLFYDITDRITNPFEHTETWGMTILTGILLNLLWWSFKVLRNGNLVAHRFSKNQY
jgi:uncharacterized membrane protein